MNTTIRLFFEKRDRAKYISHLDITRCFSRAISRTDLPVWYTEGFNPRIYMTFPLPIPLGFESSCESLDIRLVEDDYPLEQVTEKLNRVLPQGVRILETVLPQQKPEAMALADYIISIDNLRPEGLSKDFMEFAAQPSILITKRTKKGEKEIDLIPLFSVQGIEAGEDCLTLRLRLAAGTSVNLNPTLLIEAFSAYLGCSIEGFRVERTSILTENGEPWR
ncbi:MAG: TIGR03936 family radical SAM-associated protein [Angelakisella sp.]